MTLTFATFQLSYSNSPSSISLVFFFSHLISHFSCLASFFSFLSFLSPIISCFFPEKFFLVPIIFSHHIIDHFFASSVMPKNLSSTLKKGFITFQFTLIQNRQKANACSFDRFISINTNIYLFLSKIITNNFLILI